MGVPDSDSTRRGSHSSIAGEKVRPGSQSLQKILARYIAVGAGLALLGCWIWWATL